MAINRNINRVFLAEGYNDALKIFKKIQHTIITLSKNLDQIDYKDKKFIEPPKKALKDSSDAISRVLKDATNDQISEKGILFNLSTYLSKTLIDSKLIDELADAVGEDNINFILDQISGDLKRVYISIEKGQKSKNKFGDLKAAIQAGEWGNVTGDVGSALARLTPFAPILEAVGGFAYNAWDKANKASWEKSTDQFHRNVKGIGAGSIGDVMSSTAGSRGRGQNYAGVATGIGGVGAGIGIGAELFNFFNKDAFFAQWTAQLLDNVKIIAGKSGGNTTFSNLGSLANSFLKFLPLIGVLTTVGMGIWDAFKGISKANEWFNTKNATAGQNTSAGIGGFLGGTGPGVFDKGSIGAKAGNIGWNAAKGAGIGALLSSLLSIGALGAEAFTGPVGWSLIPETLALSGGGALAGAGIGAGLGAIGGKDIAKALYMPGWFNNKPIQNNSNATQVATLKQILDETKKGNDIFQKQTTSTASIPSSKPRVVYKDIGDVTTELVNTGSVGQPNR